MEDVLHRPSAKQTPHPKELNSYRPVALTSHLMKTLERLVLVPSAPADGDDREYRGLIQDFADWCLRNNLQNNAGKTKELVVDFRRRSHSPPAPVSIQGTDIDTVKSYKRLRSFGVQGPLLRTFYDSVVASAIFYGIVCWASSSITDRDRRRMDRLVRRASSVLGCPLDSVEVMGNRRMMAKLSSLLNQHVPPSTGHSDSSGQLL
ncbi:hypothetical protein L3Q82_023379, partial [Scortum barcoo]